MALVPKWGGTDKAVPLKGFFGNIKSTAHIGKWSNEDMLRIANAEIDRRG